MSDAAPAHHGSGGRTRKPGTRPRSPEVQRRYRAEHPGWSRAKNARWEAANPEKRAAHRVVEREVRAGRMERRPCCRCGDARSEAHHDDYSAPLEVTWLCRSHHIERHREMAAQAAAEAPLLRGAHYGAVSSLDLAPGAPAHPGPLFSFGEGATA